jgi:hypothetical protein
VLDGLNHPTYSSTGSLHKVVKMGESNFTSIPTWANWWDEADLGFRMRLDAELVIFKNFDEAYKSGCSRAYDVETLSLTESIGCLLYSWR